MIKASYKQIRRPHWPRSLTTVITAAALLVSLLVEYSAACNVTDVDIYAGKNQQEANNKTHSPDSPIYICTGSTAYFYAVCIAESDSEQKRQLKWTYTFGDGGSTTHYTAWNDYTDTDDHPYIAGVYPVNLTVERVGLSGSSFSDTCKVTSFLVLINDPANFPAYVALDDTLQLGSTVFPVGGGTYSWSKVTGPGTVTFSPSSSAEDPSFSADQAGDYTVQVQYTKSWATGQTTCSATSGTIHVIDDLTVFPREAYVCVSGTKEFAAWRCVDDIATDVTSSATFSTDNTGGSMKRTTGESTGPNNKILHPGSPSASEGDDYVRAVHGETSTEDTGGDCELTVCKIEITDAPDYVLVYTGSEAGNQPTKTATAVGSPSGETYLWDPFYIGSGRISLSGSTSNEVTIMGTAPSSDPPKDDVVLNVEYYDCVDSVALRVRRMSSTTCHKGRLEQIASRSTRRFYHRIKDQFGDVINETGIPCDENLRWKEGVQPPSPQSGETLYHSSDGPKWRGGIAVKDTVSYPNDTPLTNHGQDIKAGKWSTSPSYDIWINIDDAETEQIWKEIEQ